MVDNTTLNNGAGGDVIRTVMQNVPEMLGEIEQPISNWQAKYWVSQDIPTLKEVDQVLADMGVIAQPEVTIHTKKDYTYPEDDHHLEVAYLKGVKERRKRLITLLLLH